MSIDRRIAGLLMLPLLAALAACSSSGSSGTPGHPGSPLASASDSPSASAAPATAGGARGEATRASLQLSDLPGDVWQSQPAVTDPKQAAEDRTFDACLHVPYIDTARKAVARTDFQRTDHVISVNSEVDVVTAAMASGDAAALNSPHGEQCQLQSARAAASVNNAKGATQLKVLGISRHQVPGVGVVDRVNLTATPAGSTQGTTVTIDQVSFASGPLIVELGFTDIGSAITADLERQIVAAAKQRAASAATG